MHEGISRRLRVVAVYAVAALPLVGVAAARTFAGVPTRVILGDPAQTLSEPLYLGAVSNLGNALWVAAATACLLAHAVLRRREDGTRWRGFMLASGLLTAWLAADDMLLVHDEFLVDVVGVREPLTFAVYGIVVASYAWRYRDLLLRGPQRSLVISSAGLLALSVLVDVPKLSVSGTGMLEDGAKFLGIAGWCAAMMSMSLHAVDRSPPARSTILSGDAQPSDASAPTVGKVP